MASSKTAGTWADLQESLIRVRQQYGLLPRAGWDDLIATVSYEKAISAKQRNKNLARPFLPSLTGDISRLNVEYRNRDKQNPNPILHNQNEKKRISKHDLFPSKNVLQKNMEQETIRPKIDQGLSRYVTENQRFAWDFVESLVYEILQDEILLDVVIEALTYNPSKDQGLSRYVTENQRFAWDFVESLVYEILQDEILLDVVIEALTYNPSKIAWTLTKKYYGAKPSKSWLSEGLLASISQIVLDELLNDLLKELSKHVLKMKVQDFVGDHLMKTTLHDYMDEMLTSVIKSELSSLEEELNKENEYEKWLENLTQSVIDMEVRDIVTTVLTESDDNFSVLLKNQIVTTANKHIVDMFILDDLLGLIGTHELQMFEKDSSGCLLDSIIFDVLLKEYVIIEQVQNSTFENFPAKSFHQNMFNEVALDIILTELNMLLVEDMEDILEYEQDIELG